MSPRFWVSWLLLGILVWAGCVGSGQALSNARLIRPGMSESEVQATLGRPQSIAVGGDAARWTYLSNGVAFSVIFEKGLVKEAPQLPSR